MVNEYEICSTTSFSASIPVKTKQIQPSALQCDSNCSSKGQAAGAWHNTRCGVCSLDKCETLQQLDPHVLTVNRTNFTDTVSYTIQLMHMQGCWQFAGGHGAEVYDNLQVCCPANQHLGCSLR